MKKYFFTILFRILKTFALHRIAVLLFILGSSFISTFAQTTATIRIDTAKMFVGDQRKLQLQINLDANAQVKDLSLTGIDTLKILEVLEKTSPIQTQSLYQQEILFTSFDSGSYQIPAIPIHVDENGQLKTIYTNSLSFDVLTMPLDSTGLLPIKNIIAEPNYWTDWLPFLLKVLLVLILVTLLLYVVKNRKKTITQPIITEIVRSPQEIAMQKLLLLHQQNLWQRGETKAFHSELTYILKEYIEKKYPQINALELTTDQTIQALRNANNFTETTLNDIKTLLETADLVKFAKAEPPQNIHEKMYALTENLIKSC